MSEILNLSFYKFAPVENLEELRSKIRNELSALGVKGTILLAPEGINGFLAGPVDQIKKAIGFITSIPPFEGIVPKESYSDFVPFKRLLVKLKKEIVTFRVPTCTPPKDIARRIKPAELAQWYDRGEDFVIIDTRNEYEFKLGTFEKAKSFNIDHFVDFADVVKKMPEDWKTKKIVTFCTGGIRCEKAAPYLAAEGLPQVYQLEGGIIKYFEEVGGNHWNGDCFVFDQRVALNTELKPSGAKLCSKCHWPVAKDEAKCSYCGA